MFCCQVDTKRLWLYYSIWITSHIYVPFCSATVPKVQPQYNMHCSSCSSWLKHKETVTQLRNHSKGQDRPLGPTTKSTAVSEEKAGSCVARDCAAYNQYASLSDVSSCTSSPGWIGRTIQNDSYLTCTHYVPVECAISRRKANAVADRSDVILE